MEKETNRERLKIAVRGAVQGVGFRPFVYRLATELQLKGWVLNSVQGVFIEIEGFRDLLQTFLLRLEREKPERAIIQSLESSFLDAVGYKQFEIRETDDHGAKTALILPDIATCADCLREIVDPNNRRFRYPFTNCTNCGPRFSIIEALPYDRANTSMKKFTMCADCEREYRDPLNRRFHAQPNACPACGPQLQLWDENGREVAEKSEALLQAATEIRSGRIVALKGIGGFQLIVDARNEQAVVRLRQRKHREEKPFAVIFPSLDVVCEFYEVSDIEARLLLSPEAPIVLLRRSTAFQAVGPAGILPAGTESSRRDARSTHRQDACATAVAPGNPNLGVMLPYTPLHHLLMRELNFPVVATSGNLSDDPICIDEHEALDRLRNISDFFLVHDRPIVRHVDDSIMRVMAERELVLRRARGYAPLPISLSRAHAPSRAAFGASPNARVEEIGGEAPPTAREGACAPQILAVGAHLKNTVALSVGENVFVSQHIGDLETEQAYHAFKSAAADLPRLYNAQPEIIACDMHPEYLSTKYAREISTSGEVFEVQHHFAHIAACMAENEIEPPALGVAWDGTGFGLDGTIWGGEFLLAQKVGQVYNLPAGEKGKLETCPTLFSRVAHFRQFALPGGEAAIKEPRRSALGLLHEIFGSELWDQPAFLGNFSESEIVLLRPMLDKKINAPITSSVGRLFDAVVSLSGLRHRSSFEGQAAMELEFALLPGVADAYHFDLMEGSPLIIDWEPMIRGVVSDVKRQTPAGVISAKFHNMLAETIIAVARKIGEAKVVLSGGCFQNKYLTERTIERLREESFRPYWHQRIPPNDGGIALGQVVAATWAQRS